MTQSGRSTVNNVGIGIAEQTNQNIDGLFQECPIGPTKLGKDVRSDRAVQWIRTLAVLDPEAEFFFAPSIVHQRKVCFPVFLADHCAELLDDRTTRCRIILISIIVPRFHFFNYFSHNCCQAGLCRDKSDFVPRAGLVTSPGRNLSV